MVAIITTFVLSPTQPASAGGCVHIHKIVYNSPGPDDGSNASLNGEFARLHNVCSKAFNLHGWTLRDMQGNTYQRFHDYHLRAGKFVDIHTGKGTNTRTDRYWGRLGYVWNNSSDIGTLRNANNVIRSRCSYFDPDKSATLC